jgi:hypothetical protein
MDKTTGERQHRNFRGTWQRLSEMSLMHIAHDGGSRSHVERKWARVGVRRQVPPQAARKRRRHEARTPHFMGSAFEQRCALEEADIGITQRHCLALSPRRNGEFCISMKQIVTGSDAGQVE